MAGIKNLKIRNPIGKIGELFSNIIRVFKIKTLRDKFLVVLVVLIVFRIIANIPVPGIDTEQLKQFFDQFQVFGLINAFTGGSMQRMSIVMLGLGPYITATVILQLLMMVFPKLEKLYKEEGEAGKDKFNQYGRILTVPLAAFQSYAMLGLFQKQGVITGLSPLTLFSSIVSISAGTIFLMWLSEVITEKGIGQGTSIIICAGIISSFPQNILQIYLALSQQQMQIIPYLIFFALALLIIFGVVVVTQAQRNIPVSYAKRVRGRKMYGGAKTYLPLNINPAGVMPIIFALSLLTLPGMIANFFVGAEGTIGQVAQKISALTNNSLVYSTAYFVLVFLFTFFYTMIIFDPESVAQNLKSSGGFIPGHRPGEPTAKYLSYVLNRILPLGALFLATIALAPSLIGQLTGVTSFQFLVGGTSLLILVSVVLQLYQEIKAYVKMQEL